jgi:anti-anti-sigma regulatory factor
MGRFSSGGDKAELTLRSNPWGPFIVIVARGEIDPTNVERFAGHLRKSRRDHDVIVDLLDVTRFDAIAVRALKAAHKRAQDTGWGFAVVADPDGPIVAALKADRIGQKIGTFPDRHAARASLEPGYTRRR